MKPKFGESPPKIPSRRGSVEIQSPPRIAEIQIKITEEEKNTKPIEVIKEKVKNFFDVREKLEVTMTKREEIPVEKNGIESNRKAKAMSPKLKIDPDVNVQKPMKALNVPPVPAVSRGPIKLNANEEVKAAKKNLESEIKPAPQEVKTEVIEKVNQPKRLMLTDMKQVEWSDGKNVKVKIIAQLEENIFTMCEASEEVESYYTFIGQEIGKYCANQPKVDYIPM